MRADHAIFISGALIAMSAGGALMVIDRYEVSQPFNPMMFNRFDLWTGRVERCSSFYNNRTYCGSNLV
jgi:hypothetical protein